MHLSIIASTVIAAIFALYLTFGEDDKISLYQNDYTSTKIPPKKTHKKDTVKITYQKSEHTNKKAPIKIIHKEIENKTYALTGYSTETFNYLLSLISNSKLKSNPAKELYLDASLMGYINGEEFKIRIPTRLQNSDIQLLITEKENNSLHTVNLIPAKIRQNSVNRVDIDIDTINDTIVEYDVN